MWTETSHPYAVQVAALWCSFVPVMTIAFLIAGAQVERLRRRAR